MPDAAKSASNAMLRMGLMRDDSVQNMAKMLVKGSTNGVIEITQHIKEFPSADQQTMDLATRLLSTEQNNVEQMKKYL